MMGTQQKELLKWPLVQQLYSRAPLAFAQGLPKYDSRLVNAYGELIPGSKSEYWVYKRPGIGPVTALGGSGLPGGTYSYAIPATGTGTSVGSGSQVLSIAGELLYSNGVVVAGFGVVPGAPCYFETINSNPVTIAIILTGLTPGGFIYTPSTGIATPITDATFTAIKLAPGLAYLDGWFFVMDVTGTIWNTQNQFNAAVWNALNTIPASNYGDQGVYLTRQLNYVVAMKQWTTQIFYDAGAQIDGQGSPLGPVPDSTVPYGCMHPYTVQKIDEILIWATTNQSLQPQMILMENLSPTIISTPSVERLLKQFQAFTGEFIQPPISHYSAGIFSWVLKLSGHRFYGLTIPDLNVTMVFDLDQKLWYLWTDQNGNYWPYGYATYASPNYTTQGGTTPGVHYMQGLSDGELYPVDDMYTYSTDNGIIVPVDVYTPVTDFGTLRVKQLNMMYFDSDIIKGNKMTCRATDDDYNSWSNFRDIRLDISRPELDDEGSFERRAYHFRHALACPFRIRSTGLDIDIGIL